MSEDSVEKRAELAKLMDKMPEAWRSRWCDAPICACLGCANVSGGLLEAGFCKKDWEEILKLKETK